MQTRESYRRDQLQLAIFRQVEDCYLAFEVFIMADAPTHGRYMATNVPNRGVESAGRRFNRIGKDSTRYVDRSKREALLQGGQNE